ncbi:MAG TPA: NHL repeat-containing protein, partial [Candidatus Xenobia bacterium]
MRTRVGLAGIIGLIMLAGCSGSGGDSATTGPAGGQGTSVSLVLRASSAPGADPTVTFQVNVLSGTTSVANAGGSFTAGQSGVANLTVPANVPLTVQVSATEGSLQFAGSTTTMAAPGTVDSVQLTLQPVGASSSPTPTPTPFSPARTIDNVPGPQGLAFDPTSGVLWAAVSGGLMKFDPTGTSLGTFGVGTLVTPIGVAVDSSGNLYVGDYGLHQAVKFDANGNFLMTFGSGLGRVTGVAVDTSGNVYVADDDNSQIDVYDSAGVFQYQFSTSIPADGGGLAGSVGIALDGSGHLWVAEFYYHTAA